jgi:hypothetical protein
MCGATGRKTMPKDQVGHQGEPGEQDVIVTTSVHHDTNTPQTDFLYGGQGSAGGEGHGHIAIDENGNEVANRAPAE